MENGVRRLDAQEYVLAVREQHQGPTSVAAFDARRALAHEYMEADLPEEAIEVLLGAVVDAGRLFGPDDERTWQTRVDLGLAYEAANRPHDAYGILWKLDADARAISDARGQILDQIRTAALRVEASLDL